MRHFYGLQDNIIIDRAFALSNVFFYDNRDNKITVSNSSTAPCFWKTTETTGTTRRTDATAGCHEVTYNWDNKITVVNLLTNRKLSTSELQRVSPCSEKTSL